MIDDHSHFFRKLAAAIDCMEGKPPAGNIGTMPLESEIRRAAMGICRERCAHMGEPPCFQVARDLGEAWPPATCDDPGCMVMAAVALTLFLNPRRKP